MGDEGDDIGIIPKETRVKRWEVRNAENGLRTNEFRDFF